MAQITASKRSRKAALAVLPFLLLGCGEATEDAGTAPVRSAVVADNGLSFNGLSFNGLSFNGLSFNGLSFNGLSFNGLSFNGLSFNGLSFNGLSFNGLSFNGLSSGGLADPRLHQFVEYLVECALPEGDAVTWNIDGKTYTFSGQLGLAPEWKTNACGESCQRWISSCLLARENKLGMREQISLRGDAKGLKVEAKEERDYGDREGAYFGNLFATKPTAFACLAPGKSNLPRVCGDSLAGCPMPVVGSCEDVCKGRGPHRSFVDCGPSPVGKGKDKGDGTTYHETVTVFLHR